MSLTHPTRSPEQVAVLTRKSFLSAVIAALAISPAALRAAAAGSAPRKTILLHSAWATINIGDIGHTPGTLHIIEQHLPGVHVILWASKIDDRVRTMLLRRFPSLEIVQGTLNGSDPSDAQLRAAIDR